jgi:hypothetical protein
MSSWIKAMNPSGTIANEAEATQAARSSAVSIIIGVIVGVISLAWTLMNPDAMQAAAAQAGAGSAEAASAAAVGVQMGLWLAGAFIVIQLIFAIVQWRDPKKFIAILFMVLIVLGILSTAATPMMSGMMPNAPVVPMWQVALSIVVMIVQLVLHAAGLRGIKKLEAIQFESAR